MLVANGSPEHSLSLWTTEGHREDRVPARHSPKNIENNPMQSSGRPTAAGLIYATTKDF
jgi:hypothetical protein